MNGAGEQPHAEQQGGGVEGCRVKGRTGATNKSDLYVRTPA